MLLNVTGELVALLLKGEARLVEKGGFLRS